VLACERFTELGIGNSGGSRKSYENIPLSEADANFVRIYK